MGTVKFIDVVTIRAKDGRAVEGNRKAVAAEVLLAVKPQRKKR